MSTEPANGTAPRTVTLPGGEQIPVLGVGTWGMAEHPGRRPDEIAALQMAVDLGMTVIDTAEMYAGGAAEELVAEALGDRRGDLPGQQGSTSTCDATWHGLGVRGDPAPAEHGSSRSVSAALARHRAAGRDAGRIRGTPAPGKFRYWGVSNFDVDDMEELVSRRRTRTQRPSNQVLYNLTRRGIEYDLLPWCRSRRIPIMAYSPIERGRLPKKPT